VNFNPGQAGMAASADRRVTGRGSVLSEELAGFLVDEMQPRAGEADHRDIGIGLVLRRGRRKPMLHRGAQARAFEENVTSSHSAD